MRYYIDSCIFIGAFYKRDQYHTESKRLLEKTYLPQNTCYTSTFVLDEFISHLTGKARDSERKIRKEDYYNIKLGENLIQDSKIILLQVDKQTISEAKNNYNKYYDLGLDLTDWTNAILTRKNQITNILTYDTNYQRLKTIKEHQKTKIIP